MCHYFIQGENVSEKKKHNPLGSNCWLLLYCYPAHHNTSHLYGRVTSLCFSFISHVLLFYLQLCPIMQLSHPLVAHYTFEISLLYFLCWDLPWAMLHTFLFTWFCMASACFVRNFVLRIMCGQNFKRHMQITGHCAPWKVASCVENLVLQVLQFQKMCFCCVFPGGTGMTHYRCNYCCVGG